MFDTAPVSQMPASREPRPLRAIHVEMTGSARRFAELKTCWQRLEREDPEAHVFLGWNWLHRALRDNPGAWRIVVIRETADAPALAILPLSTSARWNARSGRFETHLGAAGDLIGSGMGGFLCAGGAEAVAIQALAEVLAAQPWAGLNLTRMASTPRARRLARALAQRDMQLTLKAAGHGPSGWRLALPETEADWRAGCAGKGLSGEIDQLTATHLGRGKCQLGLSRGARQMSDIAALVALCETRWAATLGPRLAARRAGDAQAILTNAAVTGTLMMPVLRRGADMVAGIGHVLDHEANTVHVLLDALPAEPAVDAHAAATLLRARSIAWSIAHGFGGYEFGRQPDAAAARFGARSVHRPDLTVQRRGRDIFDPHTAPAAMAVVAEMVAQGDAAASDAAQALAVGRA